MVVLTKPDDPVSAHLSSSRRLFSSGLCGPTWTLRDTPELLAAPWGRWCGSEDKGEPEDWVCAAPWRPEVELWLVFC